jgi:hypothetical protein
MENKLSKVELLSGVRFVQTTELDSQVGPKTERGAPTEIKEESGQSGSLDGITIARAELARHRRNLGTLTRCQEVAIEGLLLSTVTRISELICKAVELHAITR